MARDWRWAPASFRGVRFYVNSGTPSGGRRLAVHEYPGSETHDVEDMGRLAGRFSVSAYLLGEVTDAAQKALVAALDQEGAGLLILPMFGPNLVRAEKWSPSWTDAKLNGVSLQIDFVEEGTAGAPSPLGLGERIIAGVLSGLPGMLGSALAGLFTAINPNSFAFKDAADALVNVGALVETLRSTLPVPDDASRVAAQVVGDTVADLNGTGLPDPGIVATTLLEQLDAIVTALPDGTGAEVLADAASYAVDLAVTAGDRLRFAEEGAAVYAAAAVMVSCEAVRILATAEYSARPDAQDARRRIGEVMTGILPLYGVLGIDVVAAANDVWGQAADHLAQQITSLAPIVLVEAPRSLPSTLLAYRLYGDPSRASELVARNQVGTPLLMPSTFEAVSP